MGNGPRRPAWLIAGSLLAPARLPVSDPANIVASAEPSEEQMRSRSLIGLALILGCLMPDAVARAQIGEQPVRVIFPFAPGGGGDGLARLTAERLGAGLNRSVIVENRTGSGGRIGIMAVKGGTPDGSMLLITPIAPMSIYPLVFKTLSYDPFTDFEPISQIGTNEFAIAVNPQVPVKSVKELVAWLKANPSKANFGVPSAGTLPHFLGVMFARAAGVDLRHVAYRGAAASVADLVAGHIPMVVSGTTDLAAMHSDGRVRVLVTSNTMRSRFIPDVPTFRELGYDFVATGWYGLYAPAKTPRAIVERYGQIVAAAIKTPEVRSKLERFGQNPTGTSPEELAAIQKADLEKWAPVIKESGFKPER
jgi:tripartite-type tricarboxylate transporter receptor subunit TctC